MELNGIKIKRYKALVPKEIVRRGEDPTREVVGFVSIGNIIQNYDEPVVNSRIQYIFVTDEMCLDNLSCSGLGKAVFKPRTYTDFKIIGEVE